MCQPRRLFGKQSELFKKQDQVNSRTNVMKAGSNKIKIKNKTIDNPSS